MCSVCMLQKVHNKPHLIPANVPLGAHLIVHDEGVPCFLNMVPKDLHPLF